MNPKQAAEAMSLMELVDAIELLAMRNVFLDQEKVEAMQENKAYNYERNEGEARLNEQTMNIYALVLCKKVKTEMGAK